MRVKELLLTALSRANHIEEGTPADARELNKARNHFNSALSAYSDSNLITAFQKVVDVKAKPEQVLGMYNMKRGKVMHVSDTYENLPDPARLTSGKDYGQFIDEDYGNLSFARVVVHTIDEASTNIWMKVQVSGTPERKLASLHCTDYIPDVIVPDIERIVGVMVRKPGETGPWMDLGFVPLASFYSNDNENIYCSVPAGDNKAKLLLPEEWDGWDVKVVYNTSMRFQNDDYIELPEVYKELLTLATTVGLLSEDADSDPTQLNNYRSMMEKLEHQIAANNANTRRIVRKDLNGSNSLLRSGRFICRR